MINPDRFEQLHVGQESVLAHRITDEDVQNFVELTGDSNPLHLDDQFAVQRSFEKRVVHGMLTASFVSTVIGTQLPGAGSLWYEHTFRFLRPVHAGQTIQVQVRIRHKSNAQRVVVLDVHVYGEGGEVVLEGEAKVKVLNTSQIEGAR